MLEKYLGNSFLLCLEVEFLQLVHELSCFPEELHNRSVLKNRNSQISTRTSHREVLCQKLFINKNFVKFTENLPCQSLFFNKVAGCKPKTVRASSERCSIKNVLLKMPQISWVNPCVGVSF